MKSIETYWEVEARVVDDCWARVPLGVGESFRFGSEWDAREALHQFRRTGREVRLVKVTREVVVS